jgi:hypothetical protein
MRKVAVTSVAALATVSLIASAVAASQITNVIPESGPTAGGVIITIVGSDFAAAGNSVTVGANACPVTGESPAMILCTLPEGSGASQPIRVLDGVGTASPPYPFSYSPPEITAVSAASAPTAGGIPITIAGTNFGDDVLRSVTIGGTKVCTDPTTLVPHESVTCTLPPGQGLNLPVDIVVNGLRSFITGTLSYDPPAITDIAPAHASAAGGTLVTITGTNFGSDALVTVGASPCPIEWQKDGKIECVLPPAGAGGGAPSDVRVTVSGGTSNSVPFSYQLISSKCDAGKFKAMLGYAKCLGTAYTNAAKKGLDVSPTTYDKCKDKMLTSCAKAESGSDCSQAASCAGGEIKIRHKGWDGLIYH